MYPTHDTLRGIEVVGPNQGRPIVVIGERGRGKPAPHERGQTPTSSGTAPLNSSLFPIQSSGTRLGVEADYGMRYGVLWVKCRAAVAGYALRGWGMDCSLNQSLSESDCQSTLAKEILLLGVDSAALAPAIPNERAKSCLKQSQ
jgi:hypothetical protein